MGLKRTIRKATKDDIGTEVYVHDMVTTANDPEKMMKVGAKRKLAGFRSSGSVYTHSEPEPHILSEWGHARVIKTEVTPHFKDDWVKITKPASGSGVKCSICGIMWSKKMDEFDGAVLQIPREASEHFDDNGKVDGFNAHWSTPDGRSEYWTFAFAWMETAEPPAPQFKAGDWVKITRPGKTSDAPGWVPQMDRMNGKVLQINRITTGNWAEFKDCIYAFNQKWLTPAEEPKPRFRLADDRDIGKYVIVSNQDMTETELNSPFTQIREYLGKFNDSYLCRCGAADVQAFKFAYIKAE